uniref:Exoribonuclease phosphorolytic domain-containing protein n=1 Tax=Aureoumbra lagunensis TaxID=44058 RepID=A0A7S3NJS7_9STRA|mmetsp:Transcript_16549/g.24861  ORF Transcript_16549/g.24861 Transcript_16549/m.24861 type:complete len:254 (+) Transcript_16549:20-781(+)
MEILVPTSFDVSIFPHCDGSCRFIEDGTFVIATVVGPQHMSEKHQSHDPECGSFEIRCQVADRGALDRPLIERRIEENAASILNRTVDRKKFPRQVITLSILIVLNDGAATRLALNASVLALLDAAVPLLSIPLTVDYGDIRKNSGGLVTLDATSQEILSFESTGILDLDQLDSCFETARIRCTRLLDFIQSGADSQHSAMISVYDQSLTESTIADIIKNRNDVKEFLSTVSNHHNNTEGEQHEDGDLQMSNF